VLPRLGSARLGLADGVVIDASSPAELQQLATLSPDAPCYTTKSSKSEPPCAKSRRAGTSHSNTRFR
jgi:hypothetical protein